MTQKLENSIANGYEFKLGDYISRGFDIFKSNMGGYIGYAILYFFIALVMALIPGINLISSLFSSSFIFGYFLVSNSISAQGIIPPFGTFFNGFNHIGKLIVITLITLVAVIAAFLPFLFSVGTGIFGLAATTNGSAVWDSVKSMLPLLIGGLLVVTYLSISWSFAGMIAVFHNMEAWAAMEKSRKVISKNWFMMLLFAIVLGFINLGGALCLGIGLLFTVPLSYCAMYAAFEDIAGVHEETSSIDDAIESIGS